MGKQKKKVLKQNGGVTLIALIISIIIMLILAQGMMEMYWLTGMDITYINVKAPWEWN